MQYKHIIEYGHLIEVKLYSEEETAFIRTGNDAHIWFEKEKGEGYHFLKAFTDKLDNKKYTMFIRSEDLNMILTNLKKQR